MLDGRKDLAQEASPLLQAGFACPSDFSKMAFLPNSINGRLSEARAMLRLALLLAGFLLVGKATGKAGDEQPEKKQPSNVVKLPVPDDVSRAKALAIVKQVFDEDYRGRTVENRRAFVLKLLKQADDPANDAAMQYVLLTEAATIAAEAGDADTALVAAAKKA